MFLSALFHRLRPALAACALLLLSGLAGARPSATPVGELYDVTAIDAVDGFRADRTHVATALAEDLAREQAGLPPRFAIPQETFITPETHGTWERLDQASLAWRLRVETPGAVSVNLGFTRFHLPTAARLSVYPVDGSAAPITFTQADNKDHRQLWTPIVRTDDLMVEVVLPVKERWNLELELTRVNPGHRAFGAPGSDSGEKQGSCNIDVVCSEGDDWREEIQSVGGVSVGGSIFCTGAMINNTAADETPYFLTARHCGVNAGNAASMVVYWNFHSPECGDLAGGPLTDFQTGATLKSVYAASDMKLMLLDDTPSVDHRVAYAGWDRSGADATSAVAIHHPDGDEKAISFEYDPTTVTSYLSSTSPGDATHIRVIDWDEGTTEPGSSGSPLFDQNHRIIGQLHGGYAACGNNASDWYGRLSVSWHGGGTDSSRLSNWLDPLGTGAETLDLIAPYAEGLAVAPSTDLIASGDVGGPFEPASRVYTLTNRDDEDSVSYRVETDATWAVLSNATGTIPAGGSADVVVSLHADTATLGPGIYRAVVDFLNLTDGTGDTFRTLELTVGDPSRILDWDMSVDPGWTTMGAWAWGQPQGAGGEYGNPDPASGHTGPNVYGYALDGDYADNMAEQHLTTTAIDCTGITGASLRFHRWLNVEQPSYDHAWLRVSADGVNWTDVWTNGAVTTDDAWQEVEYNISAVADGEPTVFLRWTMGTTDSSWRYSGWNIDDVELWGFLNSAAASEPPAGGSTRLLPISPNPFNPATQVRFQMLHGSRARLAVYDVRGQLVRTLEDRELPAGLHTVSWDGTDAAGRAVGSGNYLFRLEADGVVQVQKAVLVR